MPRVTDEEMREISRRSEAHPQWRVDVLALIMTIGSLLKEARGLRDLLYNKRWRPPPGYEYDPQRELRERQD